MKLAVKLSAVQSFWPHCHFGFGSAVSAGYKSKTPSGRREGGGKERPEEVEEDEFDRRRCRDGDSKSKLFKLVVLAGDGVTCVVFFSLEMLDFETAGSFSSSLEEGDVEALSEAFVLTASRAVFFRLLVVLPPQASEVEAMDPLRRLRPSKALLAGSLRLSSFVDFRIRSRR